MRISRRNTTQQGDRRIGMIRRRAAPHDEKVIRLTHDPHWVTRQPIPAAQHTVLNARQPRFFA